MWIHGSSALNSPGSWGTMGIPSPTNDPPAVYEPCEWVDHNGNFWFYGGSHGSGTYAALWKYDPAINQWTWMKGPNSTGYAGSYGIQGVASSSNNPPCRGYGTPTWVDSSGDFWMFGGNSAGDNSDLWRYKISTNQWTWMKGPNTVDQPGIYGVQGIPDSSNNPGSRSETAVGWTDNAGDLWLFGGYTFEGSGGHHNDLWRYTISTNNWTWMKGTNVLNQPPVYGTQTIEDSLSNPGSRMAYCHWKDNDGNLWLFGGYSMGWPRNDVWKYNIISNKWTWMKGSSTGGAPAVYGLKCQPDLANTPAATGENRACWTDLNGHLWTFGSGNDLWVYNPGNNIWTWVSGDSIPINISWGAMGVPSVLNRRGPRVGSVMWGDNNGHLYFFGGTYSQNTAYNDLWIYSIDTNCAGNILPVSLVTSPDTIICKGNCTTVSATTFGGCAPFIYSWNPDIGNNAGPFSVCPSTTTVYSVLVTDCMGDSLTASVMVSVNPTPVLTASTPDSICSGDSIALFVAGALSFSWSPCIDLSNCTGDSVIASPQLTTTYTVTGTDSNNCSETISIPVMVNSIPVISTSSSLTIYAGDSTVLTVNGATTYSWSPCLYLNSCNGDSVIAFPPVTTTYIVTGTDSIGCAVTDSIIVTVDSIPQSIQSISHHQFYLVATPNPFNEGFSFQIYNSGLESIRISIYDLIGREVESYSDINENTIAGNNFKKGVYLIEARQKNSIQRMRIIKE